MPRVASRAEAIPVIRVTASRRRRCDPRIEDNRIDADFTFLERSRDDRYRSTPPLPIVGMPCETQ
jgi:hypothetical protein